jgi:hypothetical protein
MTENRQDAIRALEKTSFQGSFGYHDIATLKLVTYELANSHGILEVIVLDNDMADLNIAEREDIIAKPDRPNHGANQAFVNEYKIQYEAWKVQSTAINEVKRTLISLLDGQAKKIVEDPVQGTLMRTTTQMLTLLFDHYHTMSNEELRAVKTNGSRHAGIKMRTSYRLSPHLRTTSPSSPSTTTLLRLGNRSRLCLMRSPMCPPWQHPPRPHFSKTHQQSRIKPWGYYAHTCALCIAPSTPLSLLKPTTSSIKLRKRHRTPPTSLSKASLPVPEPLCTGPRSHRGS